MSEADIDVSGWVAMVDELSGIAGKDFRAVIIPQLGSLLRACINRTPTRTLGQIAKRVSRKASYVEFSDGTIISLWKKAQGPADADGYEYAPTMFFDDSTYPTYAKRWPKGTPVPNIAGGKSWHAMDGRHWSNARFAKFEKHRRDRVQIIKRSYQLAVAARGLAKKTWWQIAQDLGLDHIIAPNYVRGAKSPNGKEYKEGVARQLLQEGGWIIEIVNSNPLVVGKLRGEAILRGAIRDRQKAFLFDLQKGVFDDVARRAKRYPGVFTN